MPTPEKLIACFVLLLTMNFALRADNSEINTEDEITIVQFTDLHYIAGAAPSAKSITMMEATLDEVKPDLVVFTGDIVVKAPTKQGWDEVLDVVISRKIPYIVTFGNHDDESELTRAEVAEYVSQKPFLLNTDVQVDGVAGYLNGAITMENKTATAATIIYVMDSHAYSRDERVKGYGWFEYSQVAWYREKSSQFKDAYHDSIPALAFFHIPLPEYNIATKNFRNKRIGSHYEEECSPVINTGMYAAMFESGDVMGTFVGHDHVNDYLVDYHGIALAYGCFSGSENTYQRTKNGARIISFVPGERRFTTYIREYDGTILYNLVYPFEK